jgi:hypothetical protein
LETSGGRRALKRGAFSVAFVLPAWGKVALLELDTLL